MITIEEERQRLAGYINHSATVFGPDKKEHGTISLTEDKVIYSDGYAIYFDFPLEKAAAVVNFFKSCGSTIGPFGATFRPTRFGPFGATVRVLPPEDER